MSTQDEHPIVIIGGGPAGLAAGYELGKKGTPAVILEASDEVGGISRTVERNGYRFDLGGHRFFTKSTDVNELWREVLGDDFLRRPRLSRIFYRNHFFAYPVKVGDAFKGMGAWESMLIGLSYVWRQVFPHRDLSHFENWTANLFGDRLYKHFFKAYTEKVWGIPCSQIASEWGAQRIKGLSLFSTLKSAIIKPKHGEIKTLIEEFDYPRLGPGQMYCEMAKKCEEMNVPVLYRHKVVRVLRDGRTVTGVVAETPDGEKTFKCKAVLSSMPFTDLVRCITSPLPDAVRDASAQLTYRSLLTVNLMLDMDTVIPDTWLYVHEPSLRIGRVQCFKNWSPHMVPDENKSSLGCEYFTTEGDDLWSMPDEELIALAKKEIGTLGLAAADKVFDAFVIRVPKAYPVFDVNYAQRMEIIRRDLDQIENLQPIGRYGMYRYNNMDHSILTGMLGARNMLGANYDIWDVNTDKEYHEEVREDA